VDVIDEMVLIQFFQIMNHRIMMNELGKVKVDDVNEIFLVMEQLKVIKMKKNLKKINH
jgi:hypothetical protein